MASYHALHREDGYCDTCRPPAKEKCVCGPFNGEICVVCHREAAHKTTDPDKAKQPVCCGGLRCPSCSYPDRTSDDR